MLKTSSPVFLSTSSSSGLMEAVVRNGSARRFLAVTCGAFGDRWHTICQLNGKDADALEVEWGRAVRPEQVRDALKTGRYDAVLLTHNETSSAY